MAEELTLNQIILILLTSALPYLELRGGIPLALGLGATPWEAFLLSITGNLLPIVPIMLALSFLSSWSHRYNLFYHLLKWIHSRTAKQQEKINRYGFLGLMIFVAIPLPGTGVWTGAAIAHLLGIRKRQAVPALALGTVIAGIIVTLAAVGVLAIW
jgi:uncharacterized membrane protein